MRICSQGNQGENVARGMQPRSAREGTCMRRRLANAFALFVCECVQKFGKAGPNAYTFAITQVTRPNRRECGVMEGC
jgi:hypothetical protein